MLLCHGPRTSPRLYISDCLSTNVQLKPEVFYSANESEDKDLLRRILVYFGSERCLPRKVSIYQLFVSCIYSSFKIGRE